MADDDGDYNYEELESDEENELFTQLFGGEEAADEKDDVQDLVPFGLDPKMYNVHAKRPDYLHSDGKAFHNQIAVMVLLYAHVTTGHKRVHFDKEKQTLVTKPASFDFYSSLVRPTIGCLPAFV